MKQISLFLVTLQLLVIASAGQEINRQEADSMVLELTNTKSVSHRIELLLNLAQFHISKPGENKIDQDSAARYIDEAKSMNKKVNSPEAGGYILLTESYLVRKRGPKTTVYPYFTSLESKAMVERAIKILETCANRSYLAYACYELSTYYTYADSLQAVKKMQLLKRSADLFDETGDFIGKGKSLEGLGDLYYIWGEQDRSMQTLQEALASYNVANYPGLQEVYVLMGRTYFLKHDYVPALTYMLKALKIAQSIKVSSFQLCQINNYLGSLYYEIDRQDVAKKYLDEALRLARENSAEDDAFSITANLSAMYNSSRQYGEAAKVLDLIPKQFLFSKTHLDDFGLNLEYLQAYTGLRQLNMARHYCELVLDYADNKVYQENVYDYALSRKVWAYMYASDFYFFDNQYKKARYYLAKSDTIAKEIGFESAQIHNLELEYKLDSAEGNLKAAFDHLLRYKQQADSVLSEKKIRQFEMMNVEYEVAMKGDSIKLKDQDITLLQSKNHLQQANLKRASLIRNITMAGIVFATIIIGLLYRQYRHKQKSNRQLEVKQKEIDQKNASLEILLKDKDVLIADKDALLNEKDWLVKEIHHRVKNNLQMVISLLNAQTEFLTHPSAIDAIKESRERMQAIAILHQKLYQLGDNSRINIRSYVHELIDNIKNSFADSERIYFKLDVDEVGLDISQSVSLGLILNEAITNAVKYAYPKNEKGLIQVALKLSGTDKLQLKIADNGKGIPATINIHESNSLGLQLIKLFSEQLEGELFFFNNNGLEIILNFKTTGYKSVSAIKATA